MDGPWKVRVISRRYGHADLDLGYASQAFRDERADEAELHYPVEFWRVERFYQE